MMRLLLFCSLLHIACCSCPYNLQLIAGGQCRGFYSNGGAYAGEEALNYAISWCKSIEAFPLTIHNDEAGLTCNTKSNLWEWVDGSAVDYKPASGKYDTALDDECKTGCTWILRKDASWDIDCTDSYESFDYYCIAQLEQPTPSTDCGNFNDDSDDGLCFEIGATAESWKEAQTICHSFGAEVASVHSDQENAYIRRLAVSRGATNGVLLGGTISGKGSDFGWVDGSDWDYTNFHPGFPISGLGECLTMDTITTAGTWMNTDCEAKMPVVCARPLYITPETAGCTSQSWSEEQIIYSPGFPNDASVPCEYFLTVAAGQRVELEILLLEANSCCDYVMITDGYVGGTILANLTGEISDRTYHTSDTNIMRVIWQPNDDIPYLLICEMANDYEEFPIMQ